MVAIREVEVVEVCLLSCVYFSRFYIPDTVFWFLCWLFKKTSGQYFDRLDCNLATVLVPLSLLRRLEGGAKRWMWLFNLWVVSGRALMAHGTDFNWLKRTPAHTTAWMLTALFAPQRDKHKHIFIDPLVDISMRVKQTSPAYGSIHPFFSLLIFAV